jgi:hypothetical protein
MFPWRLRPFTTLTTSTKQVVHLEDDNTSPLTQSRGSGHRSLQRDVMSGTPQEWSFGALAERQPATPQ